MGFHPLNPIQKTCHVAPWNMQLNDMVTTNNAVSHEVLKDLCVKIFTVLHQQLES